MDTLQKLANIARTESDTDELIRLGDKLKEVADADYAEAGYMRKRVAVLSGYSSQFIISLTRVALFRMGIHADFYESEYGLYEQAIFGADERLLKFRPEIVYFCVGKDHFHENSNADEEAARWLRLWDATHRLLNCEIVVNTFEESITRVYGSFETKLKSSRANFVRTLNLKLSLEAPTFVHFHDINFLSALHGRLNWRDDGLFDLSKIPVSFEYLVPYAEGLAAVIGALFGRNKKCLVLDLDNTLWGGVIGDDGVSGIEIGEGSPTAEAYKRFQLYIKSLKDRGVILAVCSKNEEKNAKEPFLKRTEMPLKIEDFSAFFANWDPKSDNIQRIAQTLNLGLDSFVFVDDNPAEREIVKRNLPEVTVVEMPDDPSLFERTLAGTHYFETVGVTHEDLERTTQYRANALRQEALVTSGENYEDYLKSLAMSAVIAPFNTDNLPRITQLINKTNQFNLTTRRYSESEIGKVASESCYLTRYVKLKDRFGDNGLISVLIGKFEPDASFSIETWLMSCRVLKRQVENVLFKNLLEYLVECDVKKITGVYIPTEKNALVATLFSDLGFKRVDMPKDHLPLNSTHWTYTIDSKLTGLTSPPICVISEITY